MTPTQAQIEASAKAMQERHKDGGGDMNWYRKMAETALTAAAEIGEQDTTQRLLGEIIEEVKRLNQEAQAATIERCAQEIEGRYFKHINDAAAAIRALKDKA